MTRWLALLNCIKQNKNANNAGVQSAVLKVMSQIL